MKRIASVLICILSIFSIVGCDSRECQCGRCIGQADRIDRFALGQECLSSRGDGSSAVIKEVCLTDEVLGQRAEGGFIVFSGYLYSRSFAFSTEEISLDIFGSSHMGTGALPQFCPMLSYRLSDADLRIGGECGRIEGDFDLVFALCVEDYEYLCGLAGSDASDQVILSVNLGVYWSGHASEFTANAWQIEIGNKRFSLE